MLILDGSRGEGGGQMLRTALVWSVATGTPFRMTDIRAGRKDPGLKPQHVTILKSLRHFGDVSFKGAAPGSSVVEFHPSALRGAEATVDIGTSPTPRRCRSSESMRESEGSARRREPVARPRCLA